MKIAILGYGVVGSGTYDVLTASGYDVKKVLDIKKNEALGEASTTDFNDILNDPEIGVVAEAIGGLEPAHTFLVKAIKAKKHVVSSNKHLVCTYYDELHSLALENGVTCRFTASAGGGIPWLYNLRRATRCDVIEKVFGIMNGTTNYILDSMISEQRDFADVLSEAQRLGYAEADPSADIDGLDTARKTAISSSIAFKTTVSEENVPIFSLRNIKKCDIEYINNKLNKTLRYVGTGVIESGSLSLSVEPLIISYDSILSNVKKNNNMISLVGKNVGQLSFFGQGAGKYPTGVSVAQDVIDVVNGDMRQSFSSENVTVDNSSVSKKYYVRTKSKISEELIESFEIKDENYYYITKPISTVAIHRLSEVIYSEDGESFFAGIER